MNSYADSLYKLSDALLAIHKIVNMLTKLHFWTIKNSTLNVVPNWVLQMAT